MKLQKSLRGKLFFWYATSLVTITAFFYFAVHIFSLPYGNFIFLILLLLLALEGLFIINKMTSGLTKLSTKIKTITSKNLSQKVTGINQKDEIGELADSFNQLLDRLAEAFQRERQFIGDVAHELKTPISGLRGGLELVLTRDRSKEEYKKAIEEAVIDTNRISDTLKNILDLAWSQADDGQKGEIKINLSEIVIEIKEITTKLAYNKNITVEGSIEPGIQVSGRRDKLSRALLNIVDNAVKFTQKDGTVTVDLFRKNGTCAFLVKDTGIGISQKDLPHIFDRFYRGSKTDKTFGSGLGLAISKAIIKAHKGTIEVKSKVGQGSLFTIVLPSFSS